jgi:chemotaxis protein histidine kinase CheA
VQIAITISGLRQTERSLTSIVTLLNQIFEPYSRREFETLVSVLQRLTTRLQEYVEMQARQPLAQLTPKLRNARNLPRSQ